VTDGSLSNLEAGVEDDPIVVLPGSPLARLSGEDGQTVMVLRGAIERDTVRSVEAALESMTSGRAMTLVLSSRGGRAMAAFKIGMLLQGASSHLRVVVPRSARSAATLLALAGDSLMLGAVAELGPLDASLVVRPFRGCEVMTWSTADLPHLSRIAADWFDGDAGAMFGALSLDGPTLAALSGLYKAEESIRQLARRLLAGRRPDSVSGGDDVIQRLLTGYVSHDFPILRDEARNLGLPVIGSSGDDDRMLSGVHRQCEALVRLRGNNDDTRHVLILGGPSGWSFIGNSGAES
jgi:hypothetical protein